MSGESSEWACEVPTEPRENTEVSKIHFFDMTTPFECNVRRADYSLMVACVGDSQYGRSHEIARQLIAMMRARRDGALEKPDAQIEAVSRDAKRRAHNKSAKQSDGHERMKRRSGIGNGNARNCVHWQPPNVSTKNVNFSLIKTSVPQQQLEFRMWLMRDSHPGFALKLNLIHSSSGKLLGK